MPGDTPFTNQLFDLQGIQILQREPVHKVGTDAVLLGGWIAKVVPSVHRILDAGTGTGILALMAARHFQSAIIHAIDIDPESVELALLNVIHSNLSGRISVTLADLINPGDGQSLKYDLVVSNPPYYNTGILPVSESKSRAKHMTVPESSWMTGLQRSTDQGGHICVIVSGESAVHWVREANALGYYTCDRLDVFSNAGDNVPKRVLLHFSATLQKPAISRLDIYKRDQTYTDEYLQLTGIQVKDQITGLLKPKEK